ncbi:MAG TPA: hypothetical protein VHS31_07750 [Tepidisphaeraceae bacterium]|jgi:hypothetical protein|nr:hypothetical protein [Tepidisphaeraceae bacterium]
MDDPIVIPTVSVKYTHDGKFAAADALGMGPMKTRMRLQRDERCLSRAIPYR